MTNSTHIPPIRIKNGYLVVFEGIDGAGKTTLIDTVAKRLKEDGYLVTTTRQPGGTEMGSAVRTIVHEYAGRIDPKAEFLLYAADRAEHTTKVLIPALRDGHLVLSDRMGDSSLAYQGCGRGVDCRMINLINQWAMETVHPNLTFYVRLSPERAAERIQKRGEALTALEQENQEFFTRVAQGFDAMYHQQDDVVILDATQTPAELCEQTYTALRRFLKKIEEAA